MVNLDLTEPLTEIALKGNLILFIGSGVSKNCGLPLWNELLKELLVSWPEGIKQIGQTEPLELLEAYIKKFCDNNSIQIKKKIKEILTKTEEKSQLSGIHKQLSRLPVTRIYTTNYDTLLNKTFPDALPLISKSDLIEHKPEQNKKEIIYLHGCVEDPLEMKVTNSEFWTFWEERRFLRERLEIDLHDKNFLFLGYSFSDTHLKELLQKIKAYCPKKSEFIHYAVFLGDNDNIKEEIKDINLGKLNIKSVYIDKPESLADLLKKIGDKCDKKRKELENISTAKILSCVTSSITKYITAEDSKKLVEYDYNGAFDKALNHIEVLFNMLKGISINDIELEEAKCYLLGQKIYFLLQSQKKLQYEQLLKKSLKQYPLSPWLLVESIRKNFIENKTDDVLKQLAKISDKNRQKISLFDFFEFFIWLKKGNYKSAENILTTSVIINSEKHVVRKKIMEAELLLAIGRHNDDYTHIVKAAQICSELKGELSEKFNLIEIKIEKSLIQDLYVRCVLEYNLSPSPLPIVYGDVNPLADFAEQNLKVIFENALKFLDDLIKINKAKDYEYILLQSKFLIDSQLGKRYKQPELSFFHKNVNDKLSNVLNISSKTRVLFRKQKFEDAIKLLQPLTWTARNNFIPIKLNLGYKKFFCDGCLNNCAG